MPTIVGLSGSLRAGSLNTKLLHAVARLAPAGTTVEVESIRGIPLYDGDVEEASGIPETVARLKDRVAEADGLLLATPEYNNSVPGVFKNAIDWMSRGGDMTRVFGDRPVALTGATPGPGGTRMGQSAWLPVLRVLGARVWFGGSLYLGGAHGAFDEDGRFVDEKMSQRATRFIEGFAAFCGR